MMDATSGQQIAALAPSDGQARDFFGFRLAADGNLALIGSIAGDGVVKDTGTAYVFDLQTGQELVKLQSTDGVRGGGFGTSLDLDGNRAIAGALEWGGAIQNRGSAYIFDVTTGQQLLKLKPTGPGIHGHFGYNAAIGGGLALVSCGYAIGANWSSHVHVFDATLGHQVQILSPTAPASPTELFGASVELLGTTAVVGAPLDYTSAGANLTGSVYLFDATTGQRIANLNAGTQGEASGFGFRVAAGDNRIVVSARSQNPAGYGSGEAYVFEASTGQLLSRLIPTNSAAGDFFGQSIDYANGKVVVGAMFNNSNGLGAGATYVFDDSVPNSGQGYCFGDGTGGACPCGVVGRPGEGCGNSMGIGARLQGAGNAALANDQFRLWVTHLPPNAPGLFFQGGTQQSVPLGEGLLCSDVQLRFAAQTASPYGYAALENPGVAATSGAMINYQYWYRDTASNCGLGGFSFSNAWTVTW